MAPATTSTVAATSPPTSTTPTRPPQSATATVASTVSAAVQALQPFVGQYINHGGDFRINADGTATASVRIMVEDKPPIDANYAHATMRVTSASGNQATFNVLSVTPPSWYQPTPGDQLSLWLQAGSNYAITFAYPGIIGPTGIQWCSAANNGQCG